jgi:hypothetical protein
MRKLALIGVFALLLVKFSEGQKNAKPIISSHNFTSKSELWESIGNGIINYKADVMYIYGKLYVTDMMPDSINHKLPTLTDAYLYPLYNQFKKNNGQILPGYADEIFLILNFTNQPLQVYKQLAIEMRPFSEMLSYKTDGVEHKGKLKILIANKEYFDLINANKPGFLVLAGKLSDVEKNIDAAKMPLIVADFEEFTKWKGTGNIPFDDFVKIKEIVAKVHAQGKKISITNCPSNKTIADLILTSKVDYLTTPDGAKMAEFFTTAK